MGVSAAVGQDGQVARKFEGLVVRLDRGSSNLPGRMKKPRERGFALLTHVPALRAPRGLRFGFSALGKPRITSEIREEKS